MKIDKFELIFNQMKFREPRDTERVVWTEHVKEKMKFYNLSESRLKKLLRNPERIEEGIAPRTVAIMQTTKSKRPTEIWLMYQVVPLKTKNQISNFKKRERKMKIISAWRYPGKSPVGQPPIPDEVINDLENYV